MYYFDSEKTKRFNLDMLSSKLNSLLIRNSLFRDGEIYGEFLIALSIFDISDKFPKSLKKF